MSFVVSNGSDKRPEAPTEEIYDTVMETVARDGNPRNARREEVPVNTIEVWIPARTVSATLQTDSDEDLGGSEPVQPQTQVVSRYLTE